MTAHDAAYVARQIGKTSNWVRRNAARLPHSKAGKSYFWTDEDVAAVLRSLQHRPDPAPTGEVRPIPSRRRAS